MAANTLQDYLAEWDDDDQSVASWFEVVVLGEQVTALGKFYEHQSVATVRDAPGAETPSKAVVAEARARVVEQGYTALAAHWDDRTRKIVVVVEPYAPRWDVA